MVWREALCQEEEEEEGTKLDIIKLEEILFTLLPMLRKRIISSTKTEILQQSLEVSFS